MPLQNLKYKRFTALAQSPSNEPASSFCPFFLLFFPIPFFSFFFLFFISMRFYRSWNGTCIVSIEILSLSLSFLSLSLSLSFLFSLFLLFLFSSFSRSFVHRSKMGREDATVAIITPLPRPDRSSLKSGQVSIYYVAHLNELKQISRNCQEGEQCADLIKGPPFETNERAFSTRGFHSDTLFLFARRISAVISSR